MTLLILFMVQTKPFHYSRWPQDVPTSSYARRQPLAVREDAMRISITHDGFIFYLDAPASAEELPGLLLQSMREGAERKVYLGASARSRYGDTASVPEQIRKASIQNVCFVTQ